MAELLIALAILGVIATFTIPKILSAQQDQKYNAVAKETLSTVSGAFQNYVAAGNLTTNTTMGDLTPYMNYVKALTSGADLIDDKYQTGISVACNLASALPCLKMHNGSVLRYRTNAAFGGTSQTNGIWFQVDPDGIVTDGTTNGPGKSVEIFLYYNGRITDRGNIYPSTSMKFGCCSTSTYDPDASVTPPWFSW